MLFFYEMNERFRIKLIMLGIIVRLELVGEYMMRGVKFFLLKFDSFFY